MYDQLRSLRRLGYIHETDDGYQISFESLLLGVRRRHKTDLFVNARRELDKLANETVRHASLLVEENGTGDLHHQEGEPGRVQGVRWHAVASPEHSAGTDNPRQPPASSRGVDPRRARCSPRKCRRPTATSCRRVREDPRVGICHRRGECHPRAERRRGPYHRQTGETSGAGSASTARSDGWNTTGCTGNSSRSSKIGPISSS